ncbi:6-phosphogluconate dehydrogenase [Nitrobacteraceae bacterium AZCC 2161]
MSEKCDIGVIGLAVMGANLARNIARHGFSVALHNRHQDKTRALIDEFGGEGKFVPCDDLKALVTALERPRAIIIMVKAGDAVDAVINDLVPLLDVDDIIIDAGNSLFTETERRFTALERRRIRYLGMGVSGGEEGALKGPSIMPGGDRKAYARVEPILTRIAAQVDGEPCCTYIGPGGAGHFVKMVHNGIEYADMQLIAEAYDILRTVHGLGAAAIGDIFEEWNKGELESYLVEITSTVLKQKDSKTDGALVDAIVDEAEQKGTGRWTARNALDLGVPLTGITEAVHARALSAQRMLREEASAKLTGPYVETRKITPSLIQDIRNALYASKIIAYAQGFEQLAAASSEYKWGLELDGVANIWRGGCIIRARLLDRIREAFAGGNDVKSLLLEDFFRDAVQKAAPAWRRVVAGAVENGIPVPAFSSSISYFDGLRRERGPANLIQGLRDLFGAHTYRRRDDGGKSHHTQWGTDAM